MLYRQPIKLITNFFSACGLTTKKAQPQVAHTAIRCCCGVVLSAQLSSSYTQWPLWLIFIDFRIKPCCYCCYLKSEWYRKLHKIDKDMRFDEDCAVFGFFNPLRSWCVCIFFAALARSVQYAYRCVLFNCFPFGFCVQLHHSFIVHYWCL